MEDWQPLSDWDDDNIQQPKGDDADFMNDDEIKPKTARRRSTECFAISTKTEYRRCFGEAKLLEAMGAMRFERGKSYHFITGGDCDSISFLMGVMTQCGRISHLIVSTWCMAAEDVLFFGRMIDDGKIEKIDFYVGEIFPNSYKVEYLMLKKLTERTNCGRVAVFKNHSKIYAAKAENFDFCIETSANINTNPRTEQGVVTIDDEGYRFYRDYFDGIQSFEK